MRYSHDLGNRVEAQSVRIKGPGSVADFAGRAGENQPFEIAGIATSVGCDMDQELVLPEGIDTLSYFAANGGNMFVDHSYDAMSCVGKSRNLKYLMGQGWHCRSRLIQNTGNPKRQQVEALARAGCIAYSVGLSIRKMRRPTADELKAYPGCQAVIAESVLMEISYCALPKNPLCQAKMVDVKADPKPEPKAETKPHAKSVRKIVVMGRGRAI